MSAASGSHSLTASLPERAAVFASLGDPTRLSLVVRLCDKSPLSISELTEHSGITRQAVTKHLRVLEGAGLVRSARLGRETMFEFEPEPLDQVREYLMMVSRHWDQALDRLKAFVEE